MNLLVRAKYFLVRSIFVLATCFLLTTFTSGFDKKSVSNTDTIVNVMQENSGLTVSVKTSKNINVHFYMFTVEGRLVKELNIYGSKKISITPLEKGIYIYDFFSNDERLKNGKIELR
jgi:hypothetical protein